MAVGNGRCGLREVDQIWPLRGSKSRNKVSVGEPAEGSLPWHSVNRADPCTVSLEGAGERPTCVYRVHPLSEADLRVFLPRAGVGLSLLFWRERPLKSGPRLFEAGRADLSRAPFFPRTLEVWFFCWQSEKTTSNGGPLGSCIDEERSELRYLVWIAEFSESSSLWTQMALSVRPGARPSERPFR